MKKRYLFELIRPYWGWIVGLCFVAIVVAMDLSFRPYMVKILLDRMTTGGKLLGPTLLYLGVGLGLMLVGWVFDYCSLQFNSRAKRRIGLKMMGRMMDHSHGFYQNHLGGALANRVKDVMSGVPDLVNVFISKILWKVLAIAIAIGMVWTVNARFAIAMACWISVFAAGSLLLGRRAKDLSRSAAVQRSTVVGAIVDVIANISSVRLFAATSWERRTLKGELDQYVTADQTRDRYMMKVFSFQGVSVMLYQIACFYFLITGFHRGTITVGDFALVITINMALSQNLWELSDNLRLLSKLAGEVSQGLDLALSPVELEDGASVLQVKQGNVEFKDVHFTYENNAALFQDKSVAIAAGERVGLVGHSGGGKSTFASLLLRLFDVKEGSIQIDGQDIRDVTQESLRASIGMIPQDPSLFHRSLMENIRYGRPDASDEEVIEAAKRAHAHNFISALPKGYNSLVGDRGVKLSGGERQRIAIARAFLKDAPLLILDEATSQLDSVTESQIQKSLKTLMEGKTTIVIAHRLSTLLHMNRILVFDKGKIIEDGTHDALLTASGAYKTFWDNQVGGFLR